MPRHGPPPPPHHHGEYMINVEKEDYPLVDIGEQIQQIGVALKERGDVKINEKIVKPPGNCMFILRYERMPLGELSLKIELIWDDSEKPHFAGVSDNIKIE